MTTYFLNNARYVDGLDWCWVDGYPVGRWTDPDYGYRPTGPATNYPPLWWSGRGRYPNHYNAARILVSQFAR